MFNNTVWIIVPVYNAEKTLKKCVKSVQKQTYNEWKLVLVNDGSKDKSGEMCDKIAAKDNRITVIHQKNAGPSAARKNGISSIPDCGWCTFLDSDDWLPDTALEQLVNDAQRSHAEIVCGKMTRLLFGMVVPGQAYQTCFSNPGFYPYEKMIEKLYVSCFGSYDFPVTLCGKLYKVELLKKVMTQNIETPKLYAEDLDINLRLMPLIKGVSVIPENVYNYNMGGGTGKFMKTFLSDSCFMYNRKKEYSKYYTYPDKALRMIANEIVSFSMSHLIMCERFKTYPHGDLLAEAEFVCNLPELQDALALIGEDDSGHFIGTGKFWKNKNCKALVEFACQKAEERKLKDKLLKLLFR